MRRSKLEICVDVLTVLNHSGPLKLTHIANKTNVNCYVLKEYLDYFVKQGLVEERTIGKQRVMLAITQRGNAVLKQFRELKSAGIFKQGTPFVIIKETNKIPLDENGR
jgi:predicted transcriptional regulator